MALSKYLGSTILLGFLFAQLFSFAQAFALYPCPSPYCPNTQAGYQHEDFRLKYVPTICEVEPNDTRFPTLAETVITTTHIAAQNWLAQLNNGSDGDLHWKINEIIMPQVSRIEFNQACNIAIVYESQELDYCGQIFNGIYFECGTTFNGITIPNPATNTALIFIPYLMPVNGKNCEYEKGVVTYEMICRSQQTLESQPRLLKAIEHEMGHSMGLGHYIADSEEEADRWIDGKEKVPSIMVSGEEGYTGYANVTALDANEIRSIYGIAGFGDMQPATSSDMQSPNSLELIPSDMPIPHWIKNVATWWYNRQISDSDFENCLEYLAYHGAIGTQHWSMAPSQTQHVPAWIREIVGWWSKGQVDDTYFVSTTQWILSN